MKSFLPSNFGMRRQFALTLLEMMVSITLLALIMIGLLAMFLQTQKALHVATAQADVFENARGAIQLIARDLSEMAAYNETNVINAYTVSVPNPIPGTNLLLPSGGKQPVAFNEAFWLTRVNDDWQGIGYYVEGTNYGVGTLYRFSETTNRVAAPSLQARFTDPKVATHRVSDGIVHFAMEATYVNDTNRFGEPLFSRVSNFEFPNFRLPSNSLPAFVDVEIGVLEPATLKQFHSLTGSPAQNLVAQTFLQDHVGRIHFFRERVPIRNFINPFRSNEVP